LDEQSGESEEEEVMGEGIGELEIKELVPDWGWRRDKRSWTQLIPSTMSRKRFNVSSIICDRYWH